MPAVVGETVASALLAAQVSVFARSPKYHRPRGPFCLAGHCSHCLMRIDGVPNRFACRVLVTPGLKIERQNAYPSGGHDVLGAIDWLFPRGMNHHELFAGFPLAEKAMGAVARHLSGLGDLPDRPPPSWPEAVERACDLAVVGAGPAGLAAASAAAEAGLSVELVEQRDELGGRLLACLDQTLGLAYRDEALARLRARSERVRLSVGAQAIGCYRDGRGRFLALVPSDPIGAGAPGLAKLYARRFVFCTGGAERLQLFEGNEVPGVFAARGLAALIRRDRVVPGPRAVVVGSTPEALALAGLLAECGVELAALVDPDGRLSEARWPLLQGWRVKRARGRARLRGLEVVKEDRAQSIACDFCALAQPPSALYDLARQAGCPVSFDEARGAYRVEAREDGATREPDVLAAGEVTGPCTALEASERGARAGAAACAGLRAERA